MEATATIVTQNVEDRPGSRWLRWGGTAASAVLDQGLFAGTNFLVNILLARWLAPDTYGAFTIAYSTFLLLGTVHTAVLTAPMLTFGAGKYAGEFHAYLGLLLRGHVVLTTAMSLILAGAAAVSWKVGSSSLALALFGLACAAPFILLLWLARSAFYVGLRPQWAATGGALYFVLSTAGMYVLYRTHHVSPLSVLLAMGGASLLVGGWLVAMLRPQFRMATDDVRAAVLSDHLRYAKWSSAADTTGWLAGNLHYFVLSSTAGLAATAAMRVLDTMLLPYWHYQAALSRLLVPVLGARSHDSNGRLLPAVVRFSLLWGGQALLAYILIGSFAGMVMPLLFGSTYARHSGLLAWYGLILIPEAIGTVAFSLFRAVVRTDLMFLYQCIMSASLLVGFLLVARQGLPGIISARIVVSYALLPFIIVSARAVCTARRVV